MFHGQPDVDHILIELFEGAVRYSSRVASVTATLSLAVPNTGNSLSSWHDVTVQRLSPSNHLLRVDNVSTSDLTTRLELLALFFGAVIARIQILV